MMMGDDDDENNNNKKIHVFQLKLLQIQFNSIAFVLVFEISEHVQPILFLFFLSLPVCVCIQICTTARKKESEREEKKRRRHLFVYLLCARLHYIYDEVEKLEYIAIEGRK